MLAKPIYVIDGRAHAVPQSEEPPGTLLGREILRRRPGVRC
jgi:hypothetical protein